MFSLTFKYSNRVIKEIIEEFEEWYGIKLRESQLEKLLKENTDLIFEISPSGMDGTVSREKLAEAICEDIGMSRSWPVYADGDKAMNKFVKELKVKAKAHGYKVTGFEAY